MNTKLLHDVVLDSLELHASYTISSLEFPHARRRLVVGSGNALPTGMVVFEDTSAEFVDEGQYERALDQIEDLDAAVVISASGESHAPGAVEAILQRGLDCYLLTCEPTSSAADLLPRERVVVTRSNPEPITYNTSTYLGMILAKTRENPRNIHRYLTEEVAPAIPDMSGARAFYLIVPAAYDRLRPMFLTKFDELFGGRLNGRCYTPEQTLHAKTLVPWDKEMFIGFDFDNRFFGVPVMRLDFSPFPSWASYGTMLAVGYYVIGRIQEQFEPWFMNHADAYRRSRAELFRAVTGGY